MMDPLISLSFRLYQFDEIPQMTRLLSCFAASFTHGRSLENEQLEEFPNVLKNSSGALIGGSCTGGGLGLVLLLVILYILYKLCKPDNRIEDYPRCEHCGRIRSDSRRHGDGDINAVNLALEVCTCCMLS